MAKQNQRPVYEEQAPSSGAPLLKVLFTAACFGMAVLMLYLTIAQPMQGSGLFTIRNIVRGLAGVMSPLLAVMLVWIGVLLVCSLRGSRVRVINVIMNALLFIFAFTAVQLFSARTVIEQHMSITTFANFVSKSYQLGMGGGAIGALLAYPLYMFDLVGGFLLLVLGALLCLLVTGRAQKFYRWTRTQAEAGQHRREQKLNQRNVKRMFDYDQSDYEPDEYDGFDSRPVRRNPPPRRPSPAQPERRPRTAAAQDYMIIDTPAPQPKPERKPAPRKKLYKEIVDSEAAVETPPETGMDIPKPLRELRKTVTVEEESAPRPRRKSASKFPKDIPDYFSVAEEEESAAQPEAEDETEAFTPRNYNSRAPKPRRVVEGVQPLAVDGIIEAPNPEEDDDDAPFDIPHTPAKPAKFSRKKAEAAPEENEEEEGYNYPPIDLLEQSEQTKNPNAHKEQDRVKADKLIETLQSFGIESRLIGVAHGPAVTRFELQPAPGV